MRKLMFAAVVAGSLALGAVACSKDGQAGAITAAKAGGAAEAAVPAPGAEAATGKQYTISAAPVQLRAGATGVATVTIKPNKGLKFNKEFPAKFMVDAAPFAKATKDKLTLKDGDVKVAGTDGVLTIPLQGLAAGGGELRVTGNFSVCNDEQCFMLRGEALTVAVTVR